MNCQDDLISRGEVCPLVPIEAQGSGLPVVAFDACSNVEIIKEGESGFLVELGDLEGTVDKVLKIIKNDGLREKMGNEGWNNLPK